MSEKLYLLTRRDFLRLTVVGASTSIILDSCAQLPKKLPSEITAKPKVTYKNAILTDYISTDLVKRFELEKLAPVSTYVYELQTTDNIPTSIHIYHPSVRVNADGLYTQYEVFNQRNLAKIVGALKEGRTKSRDYQEDQKDPETVFFQYPYSYRKVPALPTGIFSFSGAVKQRLMLLVSDNNAPQWSNIGDAVTRLYLPPGTTNPVFMTVVNIDRLAAREDKNLNLNAGIITEICNQTIKAIGTVNGRVAGAGSIEDTIAQEGICNTLGFSGTLKRLGKNWQDVNNLFNKTGIADIPGINEPLRFFPITESYYSLMPSNDPLVTY